MARPWLTAGSVELLIAASPERIYHAIADVTAGGRRSLECRSCYWLPGSLPGSVGARFRGRNRTHIARWSRVCEVMVAEPGKAFAFRTVPEPIDISRRDSTTWGYRLEPHPSGALVTHYYDMTQLPLQPFRTVYGVLLPHHRDMRPHMAYTLAALKAEVESRNADMAASSAARD
jgi:hypothetical protein